MFENSCYLSSYDTCCLAHCKKFIFYFQMSDDIELNVDTLEPEEEEETKAVSFSAVSNYKKNKNSTTWILDSGASEHLTKNENHLRNVKLLSKSIKISIAKAGITLTASKVGTISCMTIVNGKEIQVTINDVLYVPGLEFNLLSVPKLEANGLTIVFAEEEY